MRLQRSRVAVTLASAVLALSVGPVAAQSPSPATTGLSGTSWAVTAVADTPGSGATLVFADDMLGGFAGCNNYRAEYEALDGTLSMGPVATTAMACDEAVMAFEQGYLAALGAVTGYTLGQDVLSLTDASGAEVLAFTAQPPASLEGAWEVTGYLIGSGETAAVTSPLVDTHPVITFGPDGILSGNRRLQPVQRRLRRRGQRHHHRPAHVHDDGLRGGAHDPGGRPSWSRSRVPPHGR